MIAVAPMRAVTPPRPPESGRQEDSRRVGGQSLVASGFSRIVACLLVATSLGAASCSSGVRPPDPKNELPFGVVDLPRPGATVRRTAFVSGWALDDSSIKGVRVYLDSRYVSDARLGVERADVSKVYPRYAHGTNAHGWGVEVDFSAVTGAHTLLVQAIDDRGATRDVGVVSVHVEAE